MQKSQIALLLLALFNFAHATPYGGFGNADVSNCQDPNNIANNIYMYTEMNQMGQCWLTLNAQFCVDHLGVLNDDPNSREVNGQTKNFLGSVDNECEVRVENGQQIFDFTLWIDPDFDIALGANPYDCFSHGIKFKEYDTTPNPPHPVVAYELGNAGQDPYDPNLRDVFFSPAQGDDPALVRFSIDFEDLETQYGCKRVTDTDPQYVANQYIWLCPIEYTIYFAGLKQYVYLYKLQVVLPREVNASLQVSITKNTVEGECCTNTLGIESRLEFCLNFDCELEDAQGNQTGVQGFEVVNGIKTITRLETFYVAHCIATEEFKNYRLIGQSLTLNGQFQVTVEDEKELVILGYGCYVWQANSAIALPIMQIIAISKLEAPLRRILGAQEEENLGKNRFLSPNIQGAPDVGPDGQPNDDYKVNAEQQIGVTGGISLEEVIQNDDGNKSQYASVLMFGLINVILAFFLC